MVLRPHIFRTSVAILLSSIGTVLKNLRIVGHVSHIVDIHKRFLHFNVINSSYRLEYRNLAEPTNI